MPTILDLDYPDVLNAVLKQQNTDLVVIKDLPIGEGQFLNVMTLAVQHGEEDGTNDALVGVKEIYEIVNEQKVLVSTSATIGSTTHSYGVEVFSDGKVIINAKEYTSIEDAQTDSALQVGETYKCGGFYMYKQ